MGDEHRGPPVGNQLQVRAGDKLLEPGHRSAEVRVLVTQDYVGYARRVHHLEHLADHLRVMG